jgi:hypothetical protein
VLRSDGAARAILLTMEVALIEEIVAATPGRWEPMFRPSVVDMNGLYPFVVGLRKIVQ